MIPASWIALSDNVTEQRHTYDWGGPPSVLNAIDGFTRSVMDALRSCTATADVVPDGGCVPE